MPPSTMSPGPAPSEVWTRSLTFDPAGIVVVASVQAATVVQHLDGEAIARVVASVTLTMGSCLTGAVDDR